MRREALAVVSVMVIAALAAVSAGADQKVPLYTGSLDKVALAPWGAGVIAQTDEEMYQEAQTLRVDTKGFYEGGRCDLKTPLDVKTFIGDPDGGYVLLMVKAHKPAPPAAAVGGPGGELVPGADLVPGGEGAFPAEPGAMVPAEPMPAEPMAAEPPPDEMMMGEIGVPGPTVTKEPPKPPPTVERLRVLLVTDQGELDSGPVVLASCTEVAEGWRRVVVPMSAFKGAKQIQTGQIQRVALFGDVEEYFYVGMLELGQEDTPLVADAGENKTVRANREVTFTAKEQPGGAKATYVWDFDDIDGIQEQGYGTEATWTFLTPGYYVVTLTVIDPANRKVPRTDRIHVKVE